MGQINASKWSFGTKEPKHDGKQGDEKMAVVQTDVPNDIVASRDNQQVF
jgi:hypothetical protein